MLRIESLSITLGEFSVRDVSLEIRPGEYFIILGPTGAGKTVLLETIAGIHTPDSGRIILGDKEITATEPRLRKIGMVYQDYMLFPHLTVEDNIVFGLRQRKVPKEKQQALVAEMCAFLEIGHLKKRYPGTLSGGEQQRVALARALVLKPEILLLDEPLSALDGRTRERMRRELSRIRKCTGTTIIQITHHFDDVFALADRIAIMREGQIIQTGETSEVFLHPVDTFVAEFLGIGNIIRGTSSRSGDIARIMTRHGTAFFAASGLTGDVVATLHAEDVILSEAPFASSARNCLSGTVTEIIPAGSTIRVILDVGFPLTALLTRESCHELHLEPGSTVCATFKASAVHVIPAGSI
ncbi:ATP-binding cassette domain-containing protein [Methanoregula sp.]|uniref:ATP-binding cassette domain-containing protein n=1 Tax=Methanoregula sp. TaxID=2052170 RepID=UPI002375DB65|nr:ATP-binding cassette domain-containing protein [Methanoregula sp.]MDD1687825.1 ATP-binding cassette domain-containing protein [Methanoregula sp.]